MRTAVSSKVLYVAIPVLVGVGPGCTGVAGDEQAHGAPTTPNSMLLVAALEDPISTLHSRAGDPIELRTVHVVRLPGGGAVPTGTIIRGHVALVRSGRGTGDRPELVLRFTTIEIDGHGYEIASAPFLLHGRRGRQPQAANLVAHRVTGTTADDSRMRDQRTAVGRTVGVALGNGATVPTHKGDLLLPAGKHLRLRVTAPASETRIT